MTSQAAEAQAPETWTADDGDAPLVHAATRKRLLRRLMDVVALPSSRTSVQDRAIAGDLLLEVLLHVDPSERDLCARRLEQMSQAPKRLLRYLAMQTTPACERLLSENIGLDEADLAYIALQSGAPQRLAIARRKDAGPGVSRAIAASGDPVAMKALLENNTSVLSDQAIDLMVVASRDANELTPLLAQREEMRPANALAMFWWCKKQVRRSILTRFSAERSMLIDECADIFREAAENGAWSDPVIRKALQVIERRQRNRAAIERSPFESLEDAVLAASKNGMDPFTMDEISLLSGIHPTTGKRIMTDPGGEGVAILCKATGLRRRFLRELWVGLGRAGSEHDQTFEWVSDIYESMVVAKAQTVLRYWNWSLSSAFALQGVVAAAADAEAYQDINAESGVA
ncbi:MAG: DUF2336 domain-containing protein [Hyphomonadaceae bacterium]